MKRKTESRIMLALFLLAIIPLYSVATSAEFVLPPTTLQDPNPEDAFFGSSLAVGDVDNDGYDDVVVGAPWSHVDGVAEAGEAFLFSGPDLTTVTTLQDPNPEEVALFGSSLAVGDVDNDEYDDVVVGAPSSDVDGVDDAGESFVFLGPDLTTVTTLQDPNPEVVAHFGSSLAVGDVDNDGYDDVVVGALWGDEAFVFFSQACMHVHIDIKPGSWPNPLKLKSRGVLPVAVCGTEDFDVMTVDPATVRLHSEDVEEGVAPLRWSWEDAATPYVGEPGGGHDLEGDGYLDLVLHFDTQEAVMTLTITEHLGETLPLILRGNLFEDYDGTPIQGEDYVRIL